MESTFTSTDMTWNSKGRAELYKALGIAREIVEPEDMMSMRAQMKGEPRPVTPADVAPIVEDDPYTALAAFRLAQTAPSNEAGTD